MIRRNIYRNFVFFLVERCVMRGVLWGANTQKGSSIAELFLSPNS
jgi:hypothetical protein